jgi:glycosyltransferase involved in cell wall biosynthesis
MKVSVCITTYNHGKYIRQAIDSVLMQQTEFDFELIIGEDDSQDDTRDIVKEYKERYPDKIQLFLNDRKNVIYIDGKPTGRWNFINNLMHASGDFIALLEGDDYWTDPVKLQKQVVYLESHPECALCFHDVQAVYEDEERKTETLSPPTKKDIYTLEDIIKGNFIHTCSVMYRNGLFGAFPDWIYSTPMADWPLHILNAQHGDIGYMDAVMGAYRIHRGGIWSTNEFIDRLGKTVTVYKIINSHLHYRYNKTLKSIIRYYQFKIAEKKIGLFFNARGLHWLVGLYRRIFYHR